MGTLRSTLKCNPRNGAQLNHHTVVALSALLYESEPVRAATKDLNRIQSAVISYLRTVICHIKSEDVQK
jgi:hypothetical protein